MTIRLLCFFIFLTLSSSCTTSIKEKENNIVIKSSITIDIKDSTTKNKLVNTIDSLVLDNSRPGDTTIDCKFVEQGELDKNYYFLTVATDNNKILKLKNTNLLKSDEISKLKKTGNNLTVTFNTSDRVVKLLMEEYEK